MDKRHLHLDVESRSTVDLLKTGSFRYWEHKSTEVICACFAVDDEPVQAWRQGDPPPPLWEQAVREGWLVFAHNASFERNSLINYLSRVRGWSLPDDENYRCTAAMAAAMALPRSLGNAAEALDMEVKKDGEGRRIMLRLCRPKKTHPDGRVEWHQAPADMDRLVAYCATDVEVERGLTKRLRPLSDFEQRLWLLDLHINSRGIGVDVSGVRLAAKVVEETVSEMNAELARRTKYEVMKVSQAGNLGDWLIKNGVDLPELEHTEKKKEKAMMKVLAGLAASDTNPETVPLEELVEAELGPKTRAVDKAAIRTALTQDHPENVARVLFLRQMAAKSSTAKLKSFLERVSDDGRVRENLMYHGAGTGRWSGKGVQLQNVPRPVIEFPEIEFVLDSIHSGHPERIRLICHPMEAISSSLRSMVIAGPGQEFLTADYSNIEGRVLAWLAGEEWKLQAFRDFDAKKGPDLYLVAAAGIYNVPIATLNKKSPERQVGKVAELACGYQGGENALDSMAAIYDVHIPDEEKMPIVKAWRARHEATVQFWRDLEMAAMRAVCRPGTVEWAGPIETSKIAFLSRKGVLWLQLPSGRRLAYMQPHVRKRKAPWKDKDGNDVWRDQVCFFGVNSLTKAWCVQSLYGGLLAENATQAVARDIMAEAMMRMENERGWPVVLTVHDEIICEIPTGLVTVKEFEAEMTKPCSWCPDLPVVAEGDKTQRYRK
jgi:DNA polymerase